MEAPRRPARAAPPRAARMTWPEAPSELLHESARLLACVLAQSRCRRPKPPPVDLLQRATATSAAPLVSLNRKIERTLAGVQACDGDVEGGGFFSSGSGRARGRGAVALSSLLPVAESWMCPQSSHSLGAVETIHTRFHKPLEKVFGPVLSILRFHTRIHRPLGMLFKTLNKGSRPSAAAATMASLFKDLSKLSVYRDRRFPGTQEDFEAALLASLTVYVGNMSFYSTEEQAYELFSRAGEIKKIIMGLDKNTKTPCGFCFVLYYSREDAEDAVKYISGTMLDDRPIRVDFDWGFQEGRQWGRGRSGGQVRDEYRTDYDPGRGGYGKMVQKELEAQRELVDYGVGFQTNAPPQLDRADRKRGYNDRSDRDYQRRRSGPDTSRRAPDSDSRRDANQEPEKNPRFREKGDSDEEDDDYDKKRRR